MFLLYQLIFLLSVATAAQAAPGRCDTQHCFSRQNGETQRRILQGESVVSAQADPASPFEMVYVMKRVLGVDPELLAGMFGSVEEQATNLEAVTSAEIARTTGNAVLIRYELDMKRLIGDQGELASKAPVSRYAVTNHFEKPAAQSYLIWWDLDAAETARMNPRKGLFGGLVGNMGEPEYIHGFLLIEPVPGTGDSVVSYANYVIPKSSLARAAAGTLNKTSRTVLVAFVESVVAWAEKLAAKPAAVQQRYRDRLCSLLLVKR